jgi:putative ABC transport system substrate-binding protein
VLREPTRGPGVAQFAVIQALAPARGVEPIPIDPLDLADMERRMTAFASTPNGGMIAVSGFHAPRRNHCRSHQKPLTGDLSLSLLRR